uniref:Bifunctional glycosyltransferase family 2 protein/CDP-glycerol:glycerophosphate glycerophosphotransferase n=1 Tax=Streptomyces sp. NBC_00180 TaxID=2903632 RepID=A0AAU1IC15_9ACTN
MNSPDISVVVTVYNDAKRLPAAVASVVAQTYRGVEVLIVDDHSTDGSWETAQSLAAGRPGRIRAYRLPENSGGCGAPRNRGLEAARGRYVMFLDSDDTLHRDACRSMVAAAEQSDADIVSGMCVRVHVDSRDGKRVEWHPWLYSQTRTLESIAELPGLLAFDTLSTNKCYRRDFLREWDLTFLAGLPYEDLLFTAQAYVAARRITLIPNHVYYWNVYDKTTTRSISSRRHEITNFAHRMEIHRRVDELLAEYGMTDLRFHKDVKFLKHDLVLHLQDLPLLDAENRHRIADLARPYLAALHPDAYAEAQPLQAICAYLLARGDMRNLLPAADSLTNPGKLSSPLNERDGRIYWCAEHLDDPAGRRILDVTDAGWPVLPLRQLFLRNELTHYEDDGRGAVSLAGSIVNPLGRIKSDSRIRAQLEFRARRRSPKAFRFPLTSLRRTEQALEWQAQVHLAKQLRPLGIIDTVWDVRLLLDVDGVPLRTRLSATSAQLSDASPLHVRPRLTRLVADRLEPSVSRRGHLSFVLTAHGPAARHSSEMVRLAIAGPAGSLIKDAVRKGRRAKQRLNSGDTKIRVYHKVLCRLPIRKGLVVFESNLGKHYSDSPRALYEEMRRQGVAFRPVWSHAESRPEGFPADATLVRRWSWRHLRALAQADFWIDNQGMPLKLAKRPGTTYIQTWHGSALKRMGFDEPTYRARSQAARAHYQRALNRFDHFLIRSEHDVRTLAKAFHLRDETLIKSGYPRNDALVAAREEERRTGRRHRGPLAQALGIPDDKDVLLYAPTFRATAGGQVRDFALPFDAEAFAERFGGRYTLLVRAHYLSRVVLPPSVGDIVIDVTSHHDVTQLMLLADTLITDYSSVMFDYALLDRPMVFYAHDWEEYASAERGTYFDLRSKAPGPVTFTEDEFFNAIDALKDAGEADAGTRARFVAEFGEYEHGDAARIIIGSFFNRGGSQ